MLYGERFMLGMVDSVHDLRSLRLLACPWVDQKTGNSGQK